MKSYKSTFSACYTGYFVQAIINNLAPVFFVIFRKDYNISLTQLSWLIFINFGIQILTDLVSVYLTDKIGIRKSVVLAHALSTLGLLCLGILPRIFPNPFWGLVISIVIYAYGSGLIEVLVSPIVDAIPSSNNAAKMSLLHSFYCWGQLVVVMVSTLVIKFLGTDLWFILPLIWAIVPFVNTFRFMKVPLAPMTDEESKMPLRELLSNRTFFVFLLLMMCGGAAELTISQWSSLFAETGLGVSKVAGDLLGPCLFAFFMGTGRILYGLFGDKINLRMSLIGCGVLGVFSYLLTSLSPIPILSLFGCSLAGFSVSLMWPGFLSLASRYFPRGGTALFSLMALFGDVGCTLGPYIAGIAADFVQSYTSLNIFRGVTPEQAGLKIGILTSVIFPALLIILLLFMKQDTKKDCEKTQ